MQIVIDIPDRIHYGIELGIAVIDGSQVSQILMDAVKLGVRLPKGHGDLIDRKALMNRPYETGGFVEWYDEIKYAKAIIEADKEE